jgi:ribosomal protein S18 acetylase RimI-like enzyme
MRSHLLQNEIDIQQMRELIEEISNDSTIVDFEETIWLSTVRSRTRLWEENNKLVGFAFVDDYNNLQFEIATGNRTSQIEKEMVEWGVECMRKRNVETGQKNTLDASFRPENRWQIEMLMRHGFQEDRIRSLNFERDMGMRITEYPLAEGYQLRGVRGEAEVKDLVALHRAAFGTENMTEEARVAIMKSPTYEPDLDYVLVAPNGELVGFCICGFKDKERRIGYTDPIGIHPRYQRQGLAKAIVTAGLMALRERRAKKVELGTSSENIAMQKLAGCLGFMLVSERIWFSKQIQ